MNVTRFTMITSLLCLTAPALAGTDKPATPPPAAAAAAPATTKATAPAVGAPIKTPPPTPAMPVVPPPATPTPAAELKELASGLAGKWNCIGTVSMDGKTSIKNSAKITNKLDLEGWWMQTNYDGMMGKQRYKFVTYTTFNQVDKKFTRVMFDNMGGQETDTALAIDHGMADKWALTWDGEAKAAVAMPGMPSKVKMRHVDAVSNKGKELQMRGEMTMDGKTWIEIYSSTCKK